MFKAGAIEHWNETDASIQYSLFEPTEKCTTVSRSSADGHSSTLSVGFRSTPGIPIFAQNELSRQFYDEISADARDHLIKKHGYDHHFASDPLGRRMNICGGYLDLTTHRFRGVVDRATIKLLFVTGHVTICDISRKTYQQVADLPGIGPVAVQRP
ncbi:MAG: hypothetical protein HRT82_10180 [Henriciella sp.]|nr:hypothetical protein [Henriciella sp.]